MKTSGNFAWSPIYRPSTAIFQLKTQIKFGRVAISTKYNETFFSALRTDATNIRHAQ